MKGGTPKPGPNPERAGLNGGQIFPELFEPPSSHVYDHLRGERRGRGGSATTTADNPDVAALQQNRSASSLPPFSRFPPVTVHICHPCARLPASVPCGTLSVGELPETGIWEASSSLRASQGCVEPLACGRDLGSQEKRGRHKRRERKDRCSLSLAEQGQEAASPPEAAVFMLKRSSEALTRQTSTPEDAEEMRGRRWNTRVLCSTSYLRRHRDACEEARLLLISLRVNETFRRV